MENNLVVQLQEFTLLDLCDSGNKTQPFRSDLLLPLRLGSQYHTGEPVLLLEGQ